MCHVVTSLVEGAHPLLLFIISLIHRRHALSTTDHPKNVYVTELTHQQYLESLRTFHMTLAVLLALSFYVRLSEPNLGLFTSFILEFVAKTSFGILRP